MGEKEVVVALRGPSLSCIRVCINRILIGKQVQDCSILSVRRRKKEIFVIVTRKSSSGNGTCSFDKLYEVCYNRSVELMTTRVEAKFILKRLCNSSIEVKII